MANQILQDLGIEKKYTPINDSVFYFNSKEIILKFKSNITKDGTMRCLVEESGRNKQNLYKIQLKTFIIEFQVLLKKYNV